MLLGPVPGIREETQIHKHTIEYNRSTLNIKWALKVSISSGLLDISTWAQNLIQNVSCNLFPISYSCIIILAFQVHFLES